VHALGRGDCMPDPVQDVELAGWHDTPITMDALRATGQRFDIVVHCAGGSSVPRSFDDPEADYRNTVTTTREILEYMRACSRETRLVYPSSAAVYGESTARRNKVGDPLQPSSPYGYHKKIVEELCLEYRQFYGLDVAIIRFFSLYGPGLRKQLIWDACRKLEAPSGHPEFWGTGNETRDWLYCSDAVELIRTVACAAKPPLILNGGSGRGTSTKRVVSMLARKFGLSGDKVRFKGDAKTGDPSHYLADIEEARALGWRPAVSFEDGLDSYLGWFRALGK